MGELIQNIDAQVMNTIWSVRFQILAVTNIPYGTTLEKGLERDYPPMSVVECRRSTSPYNLL
jgi:hypothetical protein